MGENPNWSGDFGLNTNPRASAKKAMPAPKADYQNANTTISKTQDFRQTQQKAFNDKINVQKAREKIERRQQRQGDFGTIDSSSAVSSMTNIINRTNLVPGLMDDKITDDYNSQTNFEGQQAIGNMALESNIPALQIAGAIYKGASLGAAATHTNANTFNDDQAKFGKVSNTEKVLTNLVSYVPFAGAAVKPTSSFAISPELEKSRGSYADTAHDADVASSMSGKRYVFGRNRINSAMNDTQSKMNSMNDISRYNTLRKSSTYGLDLIQQNNNKHSGETYQSMAIGKHGLKMNTIASAMRLIAIHDLMKAEKQQEEQVDKMQNGGSILNPAGALHAHKNHIEDVNEIGEQLTQKGIPVVVTKQNGDVKQVAEIERDELIFEKSITEQVEKLWKDGSDDAMIECGKLIATALMEDSTDNTGLIDNIE